MLYLIVMHFVILSQANNINLSEAKVSKVGGIAHVSQQMLAYLTSRKVAPFCLSSYTTVKMLNQY